MYCKQNPYTAGVVHFLWQLSWGQARSTSSILFSTFSVFRRATVNILLNSFRPLVLMYVHAVIEDACLLRLNAKTRCSGSSRYQLLRISTLQ